MAIYKISDLLECFNELFSDGFEFVDISELPAEDDETACLNIDAIETDGSTVSDQIDSVELPAAYNYEAE